MKRLVHTLVVLILVSCATPPKVATQPTEPQADPAVELGAFEKEILEARQAEADVLASGTFEKAVKAHAEAKTNAEKEDRTTQALEAVARGRESLKLAREQAETARPAVAEALEARKNAVNSGARALGEGFVKADRDFVALTEMAHNKQLDKVLKSKTRVIETYNALRLTAIKKVELSQAHSLINESLREGAKAFAPETLLAAVQRVNEAERFLEQNPTKIEEFKKKASTGEFYSKRSLNITRQAKGIAGKRPEEVALIMERQLAVIASDVVPVDVRDQVFEKQVETVRRSVTQLKESGRELAQQSEDMQANLDSLGGKVTNLRGELSGTRQSANARIKGLQNEVLTEKEYNARFDKVKAVFEPKEAEVYRDGPKLIVRLRGLRFSVGKTEISSQNEGLLKKLDETLKIFPYSEVVIEGHTDSSGSYESNQRLSLARAISVKDYLVKNSMVDGERVRAIGYGYDRPLASNKSAKGRATNRRIDLVIDSGSQPRAE